MRKIRLFAALAVFAAGALPLGALPRGFLFGTLGSGGVFYGDSSTRDAVKTLGGDFTHIVVALSGGAALVLADPVYLTLGVDSVLDSYSSQEKYARFSDCSFNSGLRVYPGAKGLAVSVEYCLGARNDDVNASLPIDGQGSSPWGNGFKLAASYDFTYGRDGLAPIVGAAWKHIPRGGDVADDYLTVYFTLGYRNKS